jgi:uncharacterized protein (TIGR02145 family)
VGDTGLLSIFDLAFLYSPEITKMKTLFSSILLSLITSSLLSQSPQSIPYQAVVRNADGSVLSNASLTMIFKIHTASATGEVVYQESHTTASNAQGLVVLSVGQGQPSVGTFDNINWGNGAKFLHVLMNAGNGELDLGTQQMMSVPYALYSQDTDVSVSSTGDTLTIGGRSVVIPGISAANQQEPISNSGLGSQVLVGNTTCTNEFISITGCGGQTTLTYYGRTYDLVEIGGQCWFADNLATDQYSNGDMIPTGLDDATWFSSTSGAYAIYNDDPANDSIYGKLYNWYTTVDSRGVCPVGWHVPSDCEWMYLESVSGMSIQDQINSGWRGNEESYPLKSSFGWYENTGTNSTGFNAVPSGKKEFLGNYVLSTQRSYYWTSTGGENAGGSYREFDYGWGAIFRNSLNIRYGHSIRCLKD